MNTCASDQLSLFSPWMPQITVVRPCQRFVLVRSGKTHRHGNGYHGGRILLYSQIPEKKRHGMPCGDTWGISRGGQEAERAGEYMDRTSVVVSMERNG